MSLEAKIIFFLLLSGWMREIAYYLHTQKLTDKLMSRNFHDYQFSKNVEKTMRTDSPDLQSGMREEQGLEEDLAPINGFMS